MNSLDLSKIFQAPLNNSEYIREKFPKKQIVLHHTAGNSSGKNVASAWNRDKRGRIGTCVLISGKGSKNSYDGEIVQCFSSRYWAYHLGVRAEVFEAKKLSWKNLDRLSIGVEICNWGQLEKRGDQYYTYVDSIVPADEVCELDVPYKGHKYFHAYTDAQIESLRQLLVFWNRNYKMEITYKPENMWQVSTDALKGQMGLFTHNSYRKDKIDVYPQPKLIEMLRAL
jgi:N-acetyl-anhydromuramyl-L-alanine amidase AmpD